MTSLKNILPGFNRFLFWFHPYAYFILVPSQLTIEQKDDDLLDAMEDGG